MKEQILLYLTALKQVDWKDIEQLVLPDESTLTWLNEKGSLSRRLAGRCEELSVALIGNHNISSKMLSEEEKNLLTDERCLQREVVLRGRLGNGKQQNWVVGRTLIPESSMTSQPFDLSMQGEIPLGLTLFSAEEVERDSLQVSWISVTGEGLSGRKLLARRSRIWVNKKPILVSELFLPDSPVYTKESNHEHG